MNAFISIAEKLYKDQAAWNRVKQEVAAASDKQARFVELVREYGMEIDIAELRRAVEEASKELREDELESIAGGVGGPTNIAQPSPQLLGLLLPAVQKVREAAG